METTRLTLLQRLREMRPEAQWEFDLIYRPIIERYALRFVKSHDADVIVNDVIKQFVLFPITYDPARGRFRHLLMVAVRHRWLDLVKTRQRDRILSSSDWLENVPMDVPDISEDEVLIAEIQAVLILIRNDFKESNTFSIFEQVCLHDRPGVEVAKELGVTTNVVRQAVFRVRTKLRDELDRRGINLDGFA